jgi:glycosyltransferase involved in cell wall biosynthesis
MARIAVVWWWDRANEIWPNWRDGYRAAWEEISKKHEINWYLDKHKCRKGMSLTTNPQNYDNLKKLDVVFCESDPVIELVRPHGIRTIKAFGTDTKFFSPDENIEKDIPYFYPSTFSPWKRQSEIAYLGSDLLCVGTVQPDGQKELQTCKDAHVKTEIGYFPAEKIRDYYRRTNKVIIPAIHGSERTVLEAMSMNIPVEVTDFHNQKARSYIQEFESSNYESPREFILDNYSEKKFAEQLLRGIES